MILYKKIIQKAAVQTAAFFSILLPLMGHTKTKTASSELQAVEKKAINLLIQKQKKQALAALTDFIQNENNKNLISEARDFRQNLAKKFPTKEIQESYETSLILTIDNPKEAKKNNEDCLFSDPENLDCLIQRIRLLYRENRKRLIENSELEKTTKYFESNDSNWVKLATEQNIVQNPANKNLIDMKASYFSKGDLSIASDEKLIFTIFEMNRALALKNLSKAREILDRIEKKFADWPDIIYFKTRLGLEASEQSAATNTDLLSQYLNKCKNLSKSTTRKYRYDFDLCLRGGT